MFEVKLKIMRYDMESYTDYLKVYLDNKCICNCSYMVKDEDIDIYTTKGEHSIFVEARNLNGFKSKIIDFNAKEGASFIFECGFSLKKDIYLHKYEIKIQKDELNLCKKINCGFWLKEDEHHCLNCGWPQFIEYKHNIIYLFFLKNLCKFWSTYIFIAFLASISLAVATESDDPLFLILFFFLFSIPIHYHFQSHIEKKDEIIINKHLTEEFYLIQECKNIKLLINDIIKKRELLKSMSDRITKESSTERLRNTVDAINRALDLLNSQQELKEIELWRIEFIRFLNKLKPITENWHCIVTFKHIFKYTEHLDVTIDKGNELLKEWSNNKNLSLHNDGASYVSRLKETIVSCQNLRQDLKDAFLVKQAEPLIKDVNIVERSQYLSENKSMQQICDIMTVTYAQKDETKRKEDEMKEELERLNRILPS